MKSDRYMWIIPPIALVAFATAMPLFFMAENKKQEDNAPVVVEVTALGYVPDERPKGWLHEDGHTGSTIVQSKDGHRFALRGNYGTNGTFTVTLGYYDEGHYYFAQKRNAARKQ
jgi:hypothetical protein